MEELSNAQEQERIQYIVVKFGDEQYGIDIKYIDNIVRVFFVISSSKSPIFKRILTTGMTSPLKLITPLI